MSQRLNITIVRDDGTKALLVDQPSDLDALWKRLRNAAQSARSIDVHRHVNVVPPPPLKLPPPNTLGQRCVFFSAVTDYACQRFAQLGPGYTALFSADVNEAKPGGAYWVSAAQIATCKSRGGKVMSWCDCDATPFWEAVAMRDRLGLDGACGQFESDGQFRNAIAGGAGLLIGNAGDLSAGLIVNAIHLANLGLGVAFIGEVMNPDPSYSAQGIPIRSHCFYIDRDEALGGYQPLSAFAVMPEPTRHTCSIYTGGKMTPADWDLYQTWTKP